MVREPRVTQATSLLGTEAHLMRRNISHENQEHEINNSPSTDVVQAQLKTLVIFTIPMVMFVYQLTFKTTTVICKVLFTRYVQI